MKPSSAQLRPREQIPRRNGPGPAESGDVSLFGRFRRWLERVWAPPDPAMIDAGQRGEWLIAGIRLLIILLILYFPLRLYVEDPNRAGRQAVLWLAVAALTEALIVYSAVMRSWGRGWIGFFSGIVDVSLVTLSLFVFLRLGQPLEVTNDLLLFPIYFLAIGATSLRYDWRVCMLAGLTAVAQYLALVYYTVWLWDLNNAEVAPLLAAEFSWPAQLGRGALLLMATFLATTVVVRAKEQRTLSNRDRLTGLANRGFFDESMRQIGALASRSGDPVAVVIMDVDHFKRFNDTLGHPAGDRALITVARVLGNSFRTTDLVARYGGEEFAGLFPGMDPENAVRRIEELRAKIQSTPIHLDGGKVARVTMSFGVALWPHDGTDNLAETLKLADQRLYEAKTGGRNRVVGPPDVSVPKAGAAPSRRADDLRGQLAEDAAADGPA